MNTQSNPLKHFRWRVTLVRFLVNAVTLFLVVVLTPQVYFVDPTLLNLLLMALVLGILNATIKPIVQFFTLPFIFVSYGLIVVLINSLMMWLLSWFFPDVLAVDRLFWALVAGVLYGIISAFLESLCGLGEPIIPDDGPEDVAIRERVDDEAVGVVRSLFENKEAEAQTSTAVAEVTAAEQEDAAPDDAVAEMDAGETAEEEAESVANAFDEQDDTTPVDVAAEVAGAVAQTPSVEGEKEEEEVGS